MDNALTEAVGEITGLMPTKDIADAATAWEEISKTTAFRDARPFLRDLCEAAFKRGFMEARQRDR